MTELNELIENFNSMTTELKSTRESLNKSMGELEQSSVYIKTVLSQVSSGVMSFDEDFKLTYYNKRAKKIFNIPNSSLGHFIDEVLPQQIVEAVKNFKAKEDELLVQELDIERAKGKTLSLQVSISKLLSPNFKAYGSLITVEEVDLLRENQRVKAWKEVATRVAHEIKNPLTPVKLSAERLMKRYSKDIDDPVFIDCIKTIIYHVDLIKNLVNEFNQFARFPQMKPVEVDVKKFFEDLIFSYKASYPDISFKITIDPVLDFMTFDPEKMKRVFINLIENSIEALEGVEPKEIEICTVQKAETDSSTLYTIYFSDSGKGISQNDWQTVFSSKYTTKPDHSGLGLSIVKKIIEDHGGRVSIVKGKRHKTMFFIELPKIKL
jgi:two-component system nitrogen regulation sensor histidine kinase NtrY